MLLPEALRTTFQITAPERTHDRCPEERARARDGTAARRKTPRVGVVEQKLTDAQKAAIAEARSVYEARVAERQILHRSQVS